MDSLTEDVRSYCTAHLTAAVVFYLHKTTSFRKFSANPLVIYFIFRSFFVSWLKSLWKRKCCGSKVAASGELRFSIEDYLERERNKEELGDFTLSEYNEKGAY